MSFAEDQLLPISALQHLLFCERQCALIHLERAWADNLYTAEGNSLHAKAHEGKPETRDGERITRGLPLRSLTLGLTGIADIVLWRPPPGQPLKGRTLAEAIRLAPSLAGWSVTPVEYKRGKPKKNDCDKVQLCAQAICLEEMHNIVIPSGQIFYGKDRRRTEVPLEEAIRATTRDAARRFHQMMELGVTPTARHEKKCDTCSLVEICLPQSMERKSAIAFIHQELSSRRAKDVSQDM